MSITNQLGRERIKLGAAKAGQTVTFGDQLSAGTYLVQIRYEGQFRRVIKVVKIGN